MKAIIQVSSNLAKELGDNMYSGHPHTILTRELIQNAVDACKRAHNPVTVDVTLDFSVEDSWAVTVADQGIGMSEEQICCDFLAIAKRKNDAENQTGGFGLAKMAIFRSEWWEVTSLGNVLNMDILEAEGDIVHDDFETGYSTVVHCVTRTGYLNEQVRSIAMVVLSDLEGVNMIIAEDEDAPVLNWSCGTPRVKWEHETPKWRAGTCKDVKVGDYTITGLAAVRINGLVQFFFRAPSGCNIVIDLITDRLPGEDEYPLTTSRESLKGDLHWEISNWVSQKRTDSITTVKRANEPPRPPKSDWHITDGRLRSPEALKPRAMSVEEFTQFFDSTGAEVMATRGLDGKQARMEADVDGMALYRYDKPGPLCVADKILLEAWALVLIQVAEENFIPGLTLEEATMASRTEHRGYAIYMINPDEFHTFYEPLLDHKAAIAYMWHLACHECAHRTCSGHNEQFTAEMGRIASLSAEQLPKLLTSHNLRKLVIDWFEHREQVLSMLYD